MKIAFPTAIRLLASVVLLYFVSKEAGTWTTVAIGLAMLNAEICNWAIAGLLQLEKMRSKL